MPVQTTTFTRITAIIKRVVGGLEAKVGGERDEGIRVEREREREREATRMVCIQTTPANTSALAPKEQAEFLKRTVNLFFIPSKS